MRVRPLLLVVLFGAACEAAPPTYDQARQLAEHAADDAHIKEWIDNVFAPFLDHHLEKVIPPCSALMSESTPTTVRFVVDTQAAPKYVVVRDAGSSPFSECLKGKLQALEWPKAPGNIRYLPLEINSRKTNHGSQNADSAIISITPSNKSLERTGER